MTTEYHDSFAPKIDKVAHFFGSFTVIYLLHHQFGATMVLSIALAFCLGVLLEILQFFGLYLIYVRDKIDNSVLIVPTAGGRDIIIEGGDHPPWWLWIWAKTIGVDKFSGYDISYNALGIISYALINR